MAFFTRSILCLLLSLFVLSISAAQQTPKQFYKTYKSQEGVRNFNIPGWVVWFGGGLAYNTTTNSKTKQVLKLASKTRKLRIMVSEDGSLISPQMQKRFVQDLQEKEYTDLIHVRESDTRIDVLILEKKDKIKELVVLVNEMDEFVFVQWKTNLSYKYLSKILSEVLSGAIKGAWKNMDIEEMVIQPQA